MNFSFILFLVGVLGFMLNRKNLLLLIVSIEILLLAVTLIVLLAANDSNEAIGQTFGAIIITVAGAESAIGLGIIVTYFRQRGTIMLKELCI